ncbi:MAG: TIGR00341 family protein [Thermodesulfobacteriota bacterium]|nr:TIGR00341 family protein [Thermodesulfobacteriota bacterium]
MALRLIEIVLPEDTAKEVQDVLEESQVNQVWLEKNSDKQILIQLLVPAQKSEAVLDVLEKRFSTREGFTIVLLPVEAALPRSEEPEPESSYPEDQASSGEPAQTKIGRISREELYHDVLDVTQFSKVFFVMVVLSSLVAAIGILRDNVAIIIGAMVIAPLLGPNVALSLATTLGDEKLGRTALKTLLVGILVVTAVSVSVGVFVPFDITTLHEVITRTEVGLGDIALALSSGMAGTLSFTTGLSTTLIGVMVAVALLPPLVTFGLLCGAHEISMAMGALLLFVTNVVCINVSGVATFLIQGVRPISWWEATTAKRATRKAMLIWGLLLVALVLLILFSQRA